MTQLYDLCENNNSKQRIILSLTDKGPRGVVADPVQCDHIARVCRMSK